MLSTLMNIQPLPDEEIPAFVQRRCRLAYAFTSAQGSWSLRWAADIINWNAHCKLNHNDLIWTRELEKIMTTAELQRKRAAFCIRSASWNCHAGRTGTRHRAGFRHCPDRSKYHCSADTPSREGRCSVLIAVKADVRLTVQ